MSNNTTDTNNNQSTPKVVDLKPGSRFTANGRAYIVSDTFTIGRLEAVNHMEEELSMFADRDSCHKVMLAAMAHINDLNPGEAYAILRNKVQSDQDNRKTLHFTLRMCTAYINYEGEDLKYLTEQQIQEKVKDWSEEGLDIRPFTYFGMAVFKELFKNSKSDILHILTEVKSIKEALQQEELDTKASTEQKNNGEQK